MKKSMGIFVVCFLLLCTFVVTGFATVADITVTNYTATVTVDETSTATFRVDIALDILSPVTELIFPISTALTGEVVGAESKKVKLGEENGLKVTFDAPVSGTQNYTVTYELHNTISQIEEGQQIHLDVIASGWSWPMNGASFQVTMPKAFEQVPVYTGSYYMDLVEDYMQLSTDGTTLKGTFIQPINDHDGLQMTMALDENYVEINSAEGIPTLVGLMGVILISIAGAVYYIKTLRNEPLKIPLRPLPPDGAGAGAMPLLHTQGKPSFAAEVMHWATLGYLTVSRKGKNSIVLRQKMEMNTERRKQDSQIFTSLFINNGMCTGESVKFASHGTRYGEMSARYWNRRLFSKRSGSPLLLRTVSTTACGIALFGIASIALPVSSIRWILLTGAVAVGTAGGVATQMACTKIVRGSVLWGAVLVTAPVAMLALGALYGGGLTMTLGVLLQVAVAMLTLRGGKRSVGGRDNLAQTLGFKRFLNHVSSKQLIYYLREDSEYFYRTLPFADAMGMGRKFALKFGSTVLEPCSWLEIKGKSGLTALEFYHAYHEVMVKLDKK